MELNSSTGGRMQLQAIQAMLASGHASIRLEWHTFVLWGWVGGGLILLVPWLFSHELFPDSGQRVWMQNLFISAVLLATGVTDRVWTARTRRQRDESLSFTQRQLTKLWWLLVALAVVTNIGTHLYGGGDYFFYGLVLMLTGVGIYVQGLFSRQRLTWSGGLQILLGLALIMAPPKAHLQQWIAASAFGIGFPVFAFVVDRVRERSLVKESLLSLGWLALVLIPAFTMAFLFPGRDFDEWRRLSVDAYLKSGGSLREEPAVVTFPAGTRVPVSLHVEGDLLRPLSPVQSLEMVTTKPVDLPIERGEAVGVLRIGEGEWRSGYDYRIVGWNSRGHISPREGPAIDLAFRLLFMR